MPKGKIKKIVADKGFGFITREKSTDLFFHCSKVNGNFEDLREGQEVLFEEGHSDRGPCAENIRVY
jgi:CspA family cold shock protein